MEKLLAHAEGNPRNSEGSFERLADGTLIFAYTRYMGDEWDDHYPADRHIDHVMCCAATLNALRFAGLKPEVYFQHQTHQTVAMPFMHYIGFGQRIMDLKAELCRKYVCQGGKQMAERKICEARFLGWKSGVAFAEGYSSYRVPLSGGHTLFDGLPPVTE